MDGEVAVLDDDLGPQLRVEGLAIDQPARASTSSRSTSSVSPVTATRSPCRVSRRSGASRTNEPNSYNVTRDLASITL